MKDIDIKINQLKILNSWIKLEINTNYNRKYDNLYKQFFNNNEQIKKLINIKNRRLKIEKIISNIN